jgi:hypothetical protein
MKNSFAFVFLLFSLVFSCFATEIPQNLCGIWEGKDRYVFFDQNQQNQKAQIVIFLKEYYGWYIDRTAEYENYSQKEKRTRNSGTTKDPLQIFLDFQAINKNVFEYSDSKNSSKIIKIDFQNYENYPQAQNIPLSVKNAYEICLEYSKFQKNKIPVAILNDNLYLDFYIRSQDDSSLYRGNIVTRGLLASEQPVCENIGCYYINYDQNLIYNVRYWQTDMDFNPDSKAVFSSQYGDFYTDCHIKSADSVFSCVSGRSQKIRNPVEPIAFDEENYIFSEDKSLLIEKKEPYLKKLADKKTLDELFEIVKNQNSKRKPDPAPVFPPDDLNWHWDIIELLEKDNKIIQAVRARQNEFGPRGH